MPANGSGVVQPLVDGVVGCGVLVAGGGVVDGGGVALPIFTIRYSESGLLVPSAAYAWTTK